MQPPTIPITIRKSIVGLILIYLFGAAAAVPLFLASLYLSASNTSLGGLLFVGAILALFVSALQSLVYNRSYMTLTATGLDVDNWTSLVTENSAELTWDHIQNATFSKRGALAQLFDIGTVRVETAAGEKDFTFKYAPRPEWVTSLIQGLASTTPTVTKP